MRPFLLKWIKRFLKIVCILLITLVLAEVIYRFQWMDFYKTEWRFQNNTTKLKRVNVLVFGDSFTADTNSWFTRFTSIKDTSYFNAAIPGIGTETHRLIFKNRLERTHPQHVLVQLYIGNDLYDIQKPVNWSTQSFGRNCFYSFSNHFRVLNAMNYRLGQQRADLKTPVNPKQLHHFSVQNFDPRTKLFIQADSGYPQTTIDLKSGKEQLFHQLLADLNEMKSWLSPNTHFTILLIPHCTQVNQRYIDHFHALGASCSLKKSNPWRDALQKAGFEVLDPLPFFRTLEKKQQQLYYENDIHLNALGQEQLGKWVKSNWKM